MATNVHQKKISTVDTSLRNEKGNSQNTRRNHAHRINSRQRNYYGKEKRSRKAVSGIETERNNPIIKIKHYGIFVTKHFEKNINWKTVDKGRYGLRNWPCESMASMQYLLG